MINSNGEVNTAFGMPALGTGKFNLENSELNESLLPWLLRAKADSAVESAVVVLPVNRKVAKYRERKKSSLPNLKFNPDPRAMDDVLTSSIESVSKIEDGKKDQAKTARFLLANANDGLLYIYENQAQSNANNPYKMKFTFLPAGMERERTDDSDTVGTNIYRTANDGYGNLKDLNSASANAHIYLNDGGVFWRTTSKQALDGSNAKG